MATKSSINRVRVLQKKAPRAVAKAKYNANTKIICKSLKVLLIDDLIDLKLAKISFKYSNRSLPEPVHKLFQSNAFSHNYNTRFRNHPRIEKHKTAIFNKSFLCKAPSIWVGLPLTVKNKDKKSAFIHSFKNNKLSKY